jgi:ATP-dependent protease ClpP protease subunit
MSKILQLFRDNAARPKQPVNLVRNASEASLYIYDVIDSYWGVSAMQVTEAVAEAGDAEVLHVYINSPGGSVFEGRAIMAALSRFKGKTIAHVDSLCASAATSVALACNEVEMSQGAFFMVHNASAMAWGDKTAMRETADLLEQIEGSIVNDYTTKTGKEKDEIVAMMDEETWMSADQALEHGFIDSITPSPVKTGAANVANVAAWNLAAYDKAPAALTAPTPDPIPEPAAAPVAAAEPEPAPEPVIEPPAPIPSMTQANKNRLALTLAL